jgi:hypothetical protein
MNECPFLFYLSACKLSFLKAALFSSFVSLVICEKTYLLPFYTQIEQYLYIEVNNSIIKTVNCFNKHGSPFYVKELQPVNFILTLRDWKISPGA